jgi:glycosyltransferase involved in cell wall biosynthesis
MNNGGPAETVLDGETGYLVPPDDPDALAGRVMALLRDPARRAQMGQAGRAHVLQNFTSATYAGRMMQLIETLA